MICLYKYLKCIRYVFYVCSMCDEHGVLAVCGVMSNAFHQIPAVCLWSLRQTRILFADDIQQLLFWTFHDFSRHPVPIPGYLPVIQGKLGTRSLHVVMDRSSTNRYETSCHFHRVSSQATKTEPSCELNKYSTLQIISWWMTMMCQSRQSWSTVDSPEKNVQLCVLDVIRSKQIQNMLVVGTVVWGYCCF